MRSSQMMAAALLLLFCRSMAFPQSLDDVARKEEERRKTIKTPSKVYTNDTLKRDPGASPAPVQPAPASPSQPAATTPAPASPSTPPAGTPPSTEGAKPQTQAKDERYWKGRITQARAQLDRNKTLLDALQSRVNALATDFVNTDDPAQRSVVERDRQRALAEIERLKKEVAEQTEAIAGIEEEARRAGVPAGWLR